MYYSTVQECDATMLHSITKAGSTHILTINYFWRIMHGKLSGWDDTIVALATPPGIGAIGVIRVSGKKTLDIADALMHPKNISAQPSHTIHVGVARYNNTPLDEVVVSLYKNPRSYTGEDVIEISCHGSPYIQQQIITAVTQLGARLAKPGEFTQRAFLNGKLDLAQAEAVADMIASNTEASKNAALKTMRGGFSHALQQVREQLLQFSALIELELDFATEDVEFADRTALKQLVARAKTEVSQLLSSFQLGNVIKNGVQVAIVGKPNAGKSTLLNSLLNENRAIVSDIAGTTRDTIEEVLNIDGILFRLADTAGIRESSDVIETMGVEKSMEKMQQADLVIYLFDASSETKEGFDAAVELVQKNNSSYIIAGNKTDLVKDSMYLEQFAHRPVLVMSAKDKDGIHALTHAMVQHVVGGKPEAESTVVTNARHVDALKKALSSIEDIEAGMAQQLPGDLLSPDIRRCLHYLGEITGEITNEDQLDYIFSKFCIGK